ncbi:MAG: ankyrin repeat domain-containing protein [bacterium]|nr:ankyrin repeat domain-containing protein [bacterium]
MRRISSLFILAFIFSSCSQTRNNLQYVTHIVKPGETLGSISSKYTGTSANWEKIAAANPTLKVTNIQVGDSVKIPETIVHETLPTTTAVVSKKSTQPEVAAVINSETKVIEVTKTETRQITKLEETRPDLTKELANESVNETNNQKFDETLTKFDQFSERKPQDLYTSVLASDAAQVIALIQGGADANARENGRGMLAWAAQNGSAPVVEALINGKADLNAIDGIGHTALMRAVDMEKADVVDLLIKAKADVNLKGPNGDTALIMAVNNGYTNIAKTLIAAGADVNVTKGEDSLALIATQNGYSEIIDLLGEVKPILIFQILSIHL